MRVLVVGAGLAGLTAAYELQGHGVEVSVLEARDRVGGRVWSHRFENGTVVELGGEWIDSSQRSVRLLADDLGLSMLDTGQDFITRDLIGADPIPEAQHSRLAESLSDAIGAIGASRLEEMTIADLLDSIEATGPAMTVLRSRLEGTFGVGLGEISAADLDEEFGLVQASTYLRVAGGNDLLASTLAERLDVTTSTPVVHVEQTGTAARVIADDGKHTGDGVVVAVPLPVVRAAGFLGDAPHSITGAISRIGMGTAAKVAVPTEGEPPMFRRQEADIPAWYWTGSGPDGNTRKAVTGFAGTARGVNTMLAEATTRMTRAVPETALAGPPFVIDWGIDPWAGGCYSALGPGQRALLPDLQRAWGRVVLAGEHVNGSGTIDGAIRSGIAAAALLMATL